MESVEREIGRIMDISYIGDFNRKDEKIFINSRSPVTFEDEHYTSYTNVMYIDSMADIDIEIHSLRRGGDVFEVGD